MSDIRAPSLFERAATFEAEAHALLEAYEDAHRSRSFKLGDILNTLTALNLRQEAMFRQALQCAANGIHLAAHVMAWAACMDVYDDRLASDGLAAVATAYPKWNTTSIEDLREEVNEYSRIDAGKKIGMLTKGQQKTMLGHLHTRNQAAHPTGFDPGINEALGYVEALLKLVKVLEGRSP
ncbi:MAG: hypothetical protein Q7V88_07745 [Actinomycetota bacterium]|nr:hypothetical protein [Actinomycetota bacterium]